MLWTPHNQIVGASSWRGASLIHIIRKLGLTNGLEFCLDAGDANSYASGQTWLDLSGNGQDFFRGASGSSENTDPAFNGTPGQLSENEYFSWDNTSGNDRFTYDTTAEAWMDLHLDHARGTVAMVVFPVDLASQTRWWCTASSNAGGQDGIIFDQQSTTGNLAFRVGRSGGGNPLVVTSGPGGVAARWNFIAFAIDESIGANGLTLQQNSTQTTHTSTYSTPGTGTGTAPRLGNTVSGALPVATGSRLAMIAGWSAKLPDAALMALFQATRMRFGI